MSNKKFYITCGLEIHAQTNTQSKLFSRSSTKYCTIPNENVTYFDIAVPGTLPNLNKEAINKAILTGLATNCTISDFCIFDRKHYFYLDLPFGFQITQFYHPICKNGYLIINDKKFRINRIHMEIDTGKTIHEEKRTLLDYNRSGIPLMEIVTEPDFRFEVDANNHKIFDDVIEFVKELIRILKYVNTCNCNLEDGNLRCDVNISVSLDKNILSEKVIEVKNLNSLTSIRAALEYETKRQIQCLEKNEPLFKETRGFDDQTGTTSRLRTKETALDYKYAPDGNLPIIDIARQQIEDLRKQMPELPYAKRIRYNENISSKEAIFVLIDTKELGEFYDKVCDLGVDKNIAANLITSDLCGLSQTINKQAYETKVTPNFLANIIKMFSENKISMKTAKLLLEDCFQTGEDPIILVKKKGLDKITDLESIKKYYSEIIFENAKEFERFKAGDHKLLQFFVGKAVQKTSGRIDIEIFKKLFN